MFIILAYGFWLSPDFKQIAAGVSIFLFGMLSLEQGFRAFTGGILEKILRHTTGSLWKSLGFGVVSTTILQSSSLVSVITISFLSAGLIGLAAGIGIIFGANLGTTTGAWLVAGFGLKVKISAYAMPMLVFGVLLIFQKSKALNGIGYILAGLGFLFLGIHYMKEGFEAFKDSIDLSAFAISGYRGLFIYTGIGIFATVVMQSSHATLVLIITALAAQQISYENGLALAIGANVGTTITAIIGSMSANIQGKRLAGAHLIFNLSTGFIAILFIHQFVQIVDDVSRMVGIADDDYTLKLAVFHTIFNLVGIVVMIPFINRMVNWLEKIFKEKEISTEQPTFLTDSALDFADTAVEAVRMETLHLYDNAIEILANAIGFSKSEINSDTDLEQLIHKRKKISEIDIDAIYDKNIKGIYSAIIAFISQIRFNWQLEQSGDLHWLRRANINVVEAIKSTKHLQKNLLKYSQSYNQHAAQEYQSIRLNLALLLRELEVIRNEPDADLKILSLDSIKVSMAESEKELNNRIDELIREDKIKAETGTSLINDSAYLFDINNNLVQFFETLFIAHERELTKAERKIALDDDEITEIRATSD
ncbi:MAG: Na/Pi cotransporter family protein [Proteobacteria bacterium]|nr:Na/Pi cotransporter family protein [Pseudomonadota bacterium]NOG60969.1 Na/Pi cotransporter family protein [Pseudomonadota bacterium]